MNSHSGKKRRHSRRKRPGRALAGLFKHPIRLLVITLSTAALIWLVLTKSLPFVLAPTNPNLALRFNPDNPAALLAKAEQARSRLLEIVTQEAEENKQAATEATKNDLKGQSSGVARSSDLVAERQALRGTIGMLAKRIIRNDPLNAAAYRLLGEIATDPAQIRKLMRAAIARSRHETVAIFWLMNDAYARKKYGSAVHLADSLLRTRPQLGKIVMSYLLQIIETAKGRSLIVKALATQPRWRGAFLATLSRRAKRINTPLEVMIALKTTRAPMLARELKTYLDVLIAKGRADLAYTAWLQFLPEQQLTTLGLIYNPGFEAGATGLPFDWQKRRPRNATVEYGALKGKAGGQALHITFGPGRVVFPKTSQIIILVPGHYRLSFEYRGDIKAKRGLRWRLRCRYGGHKIIGQSAMLGGQKPEWQRLSVSLSVPDDPDCRAQSLSLIHDARSASEEFIAGEAWFDNLKIARIKP